jgi:hypothetical protein
MDGDRHHTALVAPTLARARGAAAALERQFPAGHTPFSLSGYLASPRPPRQVVLCPSGASVAEDIVFLRRVRDRLLWKAPDDVLYGAIAGLLGSLPDSTDRRPAGRRARPKPRGGETEALLLEGIVDRGRVRSLLDKSARLWIVESPGRVRLDRRLMDRLRQKGVRWRVLDPVSVVAVLVSPALARARFRWRHLLPARTPIWTRTKAR